MPLKNQLVIIHGWSDNSVSFKRLVKVIQEKSNREASHINLADYVSMDDEITFDDIGSIVIPKTKITNYFQANRTLLVRIILKREQAESVFRLQGIV